MAEEHNRLPPNVRIEKTEWLIPVIAERAEGGARREPDHEPGNHAQPGAGARRFDRPGFTEENAGQRDHRQHRKVPHQFGDGGDIERHRSAVLDLVHHPSPRNLGGFVDGHSEENSGKLRPAGKDRVREDRVSEHRDDPEHSDAGNGVADLGLSGSNQRRDSDDRGGPTDTRPSCDQPGQGPREPEARSQEPDHADASADCHHDEGQGRQGESAGSEEAQAKAEQHDAEAQDRGRTESQSRRSGPRPIGHIGDDHAEDDGQHDRADRTARESEQRFRDPSRGKRGGCRDQRRQSQSGPEGGQSHRLLCPFPLSVAG